MRAKVSPAPKLRAVARIEKPSSKPTLTLPKPATAFVRMLTQRKAARAETELSLRLQIILHNL